MKMNKRIPTLRKITIGTIFAITLAAMALHQPAFAATVSFYGFRLDMPDWRSTNVVKTIAIPGGESATIPDGFFGKHGWLLPTVASDTYLPAYAPLSGITAPGTDTFSSATYAADVDDPTQPIGGMVDDLPFPSMAAIAYQAPGSGVEVNLYNFTLSGTVPSSFLLGVAFGNLDWPAENGYNTASYRVSLGASSTAQIPAPGNNKRIDWIFFRVDDATAGDTVSLHATAGDLGMASIAVIAFDPVPESAEPDRGGLWDLAEHFSATENPNGSWSYGYGAWGGTTFVPLPPASDIFGLSGLNGWWLASDPIQLPVLAKNTTQAPIDVFGSILPAGDVLAYPGATASGADIAIARWIAPATGIYNISATWTRLDPMMSSTMAHVYKNLAGTPQELFWASTSELPSVYLDAGVALSAGDTLDFMVYAAGGGPNNDGIGLAVKITGGPDVALSIRQVNNSIRLAWPAWASMFEIESATSPAGPYTNANLPTVIEGDELAAYVVAPGSEQYFRLAR
jgi:hypothetical protein